MKNPWIKDFPQLQDGYHYFDSAATSLKPNVVIDAVSDYNRRLSANIHRGMYHQSQEATELYESARSRVAAFVHARDEEIVFTRGTTDSLNLVAKSYGLAHLKQGDVILSTEVEHHSSILPWQFVAHKTGAKLEYIPLTKEGKLSLETVREAFSSQVKILAIHHVSNVLGYESPIKEIIKIAHEYGAIVVVDGAQAIQHLEVNVADLDCDFYAFSGHKMLGPTGIGVLYGKAHLLEAMDPIDFGGDMALDVMKHQFSWKESPIKFEAGTMPIAEAIGLAKAIDYLEMVSLKTIHELSQSVYEYLMAQCAGIKEIEIYNPNSDTFIFTFNIHQVPAHDAITFFAEQNIALRAGQHCAKLAHDFLKIPSSLRGTIYFYNTKKDVDVFVSTLKEAINYFRSLGFMED